MSKRTKDAEAKYKRNLRAKAAAKEQARQAEGSAKLTDIFRKASAAEASVMHAENSESITHPPKVSH